MEKLELTFLSLSHSSNMIIEAESSEAFDTFFNDLMLVFIQEGDINHETKQLSIKSEQRNTSELRKKIESFIEKYGARIKPVFQLRTYLSKLKEDEYFLIIPESSLLTREFIFRCANYLSSLNPDEGSFDEIDKNFKNLFGDLLEKYLIEVFDGNFKREIGEKDKGKRICRFCNNTRGNTTFKNVAHAISESLGNKKIILCEECDQCNSFFGAADGIENSLITYLKYIGHFHKVKGKNGLPKLLGKNYELKEGNILLKNLSKEEEAVISDTKLDFKYRLETFENVIKQDVYRALCKYALSTISTKYLPDFKETIKWINKESSLKNIPKIAFLNNNSFFNLHPRLTLYIRKTDDKKLPFTVVEFQYTVLTIVFLVPLAKSDETDFSIDENYNYFWDNFKHFNSQNDWMYGDFSDEVRRKFVINININGEGK